MINKIKNALTIPAFIVSMLIVALGLTVNLNREQELIYSFDGGIGLLIFLFISVSFLFYKTSYIVKVINKRGRIIAFILALIFSAFQVVGYTYSVYYESILEIDYIIKAILKFLAYLIISNRLILLGFYILKNNLYKNFKNRVKKNISNKELKIDEKKPRFLIFEKFYSIFNKNNKTRLLFIALLLIICYLPFYLYYHPGIVVYDGETQLAYIRNLIPLSNQHPIIHTAFVAIFVKLADLLGGNNNLAVSLYCFIQMISHAFVFAYIVELLRKYDVFKPLRIATLLLFAFVPTYSMFSITLWKDAGFGLAFSFVVIHLIRMRFDKDYFKTKRNIILFILTLIFASLLRHNGIYVLVVCFPFILFAFRKHFKFIVSTFGIAFIICFGYSLYINNILKAESILEREKYSVLSQAFARVSVINENNLRFEEKESIHQFINYDDIKSIYNPTFADPVKYYMEINSSNKSKIFSLYFELLKKYPKTVIDSFLDGAYGYFYPDYSYWRVANGIEKNIWDPKVGSLYEMLDLKENKLLKIEIIGDIGKLVNDADVFPLFNIFISIGFWFEVLLFIIGYNVYIKNYNMLITFLPILILWLTCLISPVSGEYRYVYAMFVTLPIYLAFSIKKS